jgi:hypothetical protein
MRAGRPTRRGRWCTIRRAGECYLAKGATTGNVPTNGTYWTKVDFPSVLASWVKRAAFADGLKDQKQTDRAAEELTEALGELQEAASRALEQQGQYERASVQTYGGRDGGPKRTK